MKYQIIIQKRKTERRNHVIEQVANSLKDHEKLIIVQKCPLFEKQFVKTYGKFNPNVNSTTILSFIHKFINENSDCVDVVADKGFNEVEDDDGDDEGTESLASYSQPIQTEAIMEAQLIEASTKEKTKVIEDRLRELYNNKNFKDKDKNYAFNLLKSRINEIQDDGLNKYHSYFISNNRPVNVTKSKDKLIQAVAVRINRILKDNPN